MQDRTVVADRAPESMDTSVTRLVRWLWRYAARRWVSLVAVLTTLVAKVGLDLLKPWPMKILVDHALGNAALPPLLATWLQRLPGSASREGLVVWSITATLGLFLLSWMLGVATAYANIGFGQRMVYDLALDLFSHLQRLSLRFHARKSVGDSIRRVTTDCGCVSEIIKDALLPLVTSLVALVTMFFVMWRLEPRLTLVALAVVPWMVLVLRRYFQPMLDASYEEQEAEGRLFDVVEQTLAAVPVVQAFGQEPAADRRFAGTTQQAMDASIASATVGLKFGILAGAATALGSAAVLWLGARSVLEQRLSVGELLVFIAYLGSLYGPLETILSAPSTTQGAAGSARRVLEILHTRTEVADAPGARLVGRLRGHVRLEHISFGYEQDRTVLRDVSIEARPGETIAIVGPTGAGKSTVLGLIPRFFDPWSGRVTIDGIDARDIQLKNLRSEIAIVLQEPFLFPITIAENIAYGRPDASREDIESAARAANAHAFISRLPSGYDTVVGERGTTLSGGERQRVSIARALLKESPILLLDEPTSAMDTETEHLLLGALRRLMEGRTTFIIAHRLSTVRQADRIVALQDGAVVESGTHDELLSRGGVYARFHAVQFGRTAGAG